MVFPTRPTLRCRAFQGGREGEVAGAAASGLPGARWGTYQILSQVLP